MRLRKTARAVMLDPANRVLLFEFHAPAGFIHEVPRRFWATPGGEIEPGEDVRAAVAREVLEETGIADCTIGPEIWFGTNELTFKGERFKTLERFFHVRCPTAVLGATNWTDVEKEVMRGHHWWTVEALRATPDTIFPPNFAALVNEIIVAGGPPPLREIPL